MNGIPESTIPVNRLEESVETRKGPGIDALSKPPATGTASFVK